MSKGFFAIFCFITLAFCFQAFAKATYKSNRYTYVQNEKFAIRALQTLHSAQATYQATAGNGNYGSLAALHQAQLIDSALASGLKYGYVFQISTVARVGTTPAAFYITATPISYRKTGRGSFFINEGGEMRGADKNGAPATVADPIVEVCRELGGSNERCAISDLRTIHAAQITYSATTGGGNYGTFNQLYELSLISQRLASGSIHGYIFTCTIVARTNTTQASFKVSAVPVKYGTSGLRSFYIDEIGVLRGADKNGAPADENDPPIQE
jgi:hypothetical protein